MKKFLAICMILLVCFSVFANGDSETADNGKTEIVIWQTSGGSGPAMEAMKKIVDLYNQTNDKGITARVEYVATQSNGNTTTMSNLMAAIAAGNPPDIALIDNFQVASWAAQNALQPLDELMAQAGVTLDGLYDWTKTCSVYKGGTYSIPYDCDARAMFYNKDMFREAGLDPEDPPTTIAEVTEASKKLLKKDGKNYVQAGLIPWIYAGQPIYTWGWAFGADFYDAENNVLTVNDPKVIDALQWEVDFANLMGGQDFVSFTQGLGKGAEDPFVTGQAAMTIRGQFHVKDIHKYAPDLDLGIAPIPALVEGENTTWCGGWGWTIPRGANHAAEAMDFMKFVISAPAQKIMVETTGNLSPLMAVTDEYFGDNEEYKVFIDMLSVAHTRPAVPVGQQLWDDFNTVLDSALHGQGTPEKLLNDLNTNINKELQKY